MPEPDSPVRPTVPALVLPRLDVRLLGPVEVLFDGRRLRPFDSPRLQRFLAVVALAGAPQQRSRLAFEMWPDSDEGQARTNLRKLLHEFRQSLPDVAAFAAIDRQTIEWLPTPQAAVDVLTFRNAVAAGDLATAAHAYGGDLLPACYDEWTLDQRTRLRSEAVKVFGQLARSAAALGDHAAAIRHAHRVIDIEPTDETAARGQMVAHLALGDRSAALRAYHRCAEVLRGELGVAPSSATEAVYLELQVGSGEGPRAASETRVDGVAEPGLVGRLPEWKVLVDTWTRCRGGGAHLILLTGEPGIGKSRLADELGKHVRSEGHAVAAARAYEAAGGLPWGPVIDLLRSDSLRDAVAALDPTWKSELARLAPDLVDPGDAPSASASDMAQRHRLFEAVSRALLGPSQPCLVIIDDLQWCDTETIELIGFVLRSVAPAQLLIVGTVRSEALPDAHPLNAVVDALAHDDAVTTLPLERLDEAMTADLASRHRTEDAVESDLAARIWSETEGNPLFIIEAVRAGMSAGPGPALLTPTMRAVLRSRLDQLPKAARRLVDAAAVIGRPFTIGLVAAVSDKTEDDLVDDIDLLWRRRIIHDHGFAYDFSHDKLRAVALETISPARRRQLHRAAAKAIAADFDNDISVAGPHLAAHYDQAGMTEEAIEAYHLAGTQAAAVSALDDATRRFRRALTLLSELTGSRASDELEITLRIALGSTLVALEGYGSSDVRSLYERALSLSRRLGRVVDPPILRGLALVAVIECRFDDSASHGRSLVEHESHDVAARTEGLYLQGVSSFWQGDLAGARHDLGEAISSYDLSNRQEHLASYAQDPRAVCLVRLAFAELWRGDPSRADELTDEAVADAVELDHPLTLGYVLSYASIMAVETERLDRLDELVGQNERAWQRQPIVYSMALGQVPQGWLEFCKGSSGGVDRIVNTIAGWRADGQTLHLTYALLLLARARGVSGELDEGRAAADAGIAWTRSHSQHYLEAELLRLRGELAYRSGHSDSAGTDLRGAVDIASSQGAAWLELRALTSLGGHFPEDSTFERLEQVVETIPSGHDLAPFRAAKDLLQNSR